jgi:stringent starvation protein B
MMTPSKPYLIRGLYQWLLDNQMTPYILADTGSGEVLVPKGVENDGKVVLNLAPSAIQNLEMTNDFISFSARFNGVAEDVYCPMPSILAIYARENGKGMMFSTEAEESQDQGAEVNDSEKTKKPSRPGLKIVK